jgi:hypothetical protein
MQRVSALLLVGSVVVGACGSADGAQVLPYSANLTAVIGGSVHTSPGQDKGRVRRVDTPDGDDCVDEAADECLKPQRECGDDGASDMLVGADGKSIATICYPTQGVTVELVDGDLDRVGNNTVFVLDAQDDGPDVTGDITLDGNNVTLYGHGPELSVVAGDLHIDKNNARVRGLRVQGDVIIDKNNPSIVDCVIEGDLVVHGNNVAVALCEVWGKVTVLGNNAMFVEDRFASAPELTGNNAVCSGNLSFEDADGDGVVSDAELGEEVMCAYAER